MKSESFTFCMKVHCNYCSWPTTASIDFWSCFVNSWMKYLLIMDFLHFLFLFHCPLSVTDYRDCCISETYLQGHYHEYYQDYHSSQEAGKLSSIFHLYCCSYGGGNVSVFVYWRDLIWCCNNIFLLRLINHQTSSPELQPHTNKDQARIFGFLSTSTHIQHCFWQNGWT